MIRFDTSDVTASEVLFLGEYEIVKDESLHKAKTRGVTSSAYHQVGNG